MAKLYAKLRNSRGVERSTIDNREICAEMFYGSKETSIRAATVCTTISATATGEKAVASVLFWSPDGIPLHVHTEEYPMPRKRQAKLLVPVIV